MTVVAGEPLIRRSTRLLAEAGVRELVVVVGYKADEIRAELLASSPIPVRFVENPRYAEVQTFYSLMLTRPYVEDEPFLKLNGDVIFHPDVLRRLIESEAPLALAVDDEVRLDEEAMKVELGEDGRVLRIGKQLPVVTSFGESIGIERLDPPYSSRIFDHLEAAAANGETKLYYEDVFQRAMDAEGLPFRPVGIGGLPWAEIDDEKDYARAVALFEGRELGSHRAVSATPAGHTGASGAHAKKADFVPAE
jgi:choline kinase